MALISKTGFIYNILTQVDLTGVKSLNNSMSTLTKSTLASVGVITGAFSGLLALTHKMTSGLDELYQASTRTGVSANFLSNLGHIAEVNGGSFQQATQDVEQLNRVIGQATIKGSRYSQVLQAYGVNIKNANGSTKDAQTLMLSLADTMSKLSTAEQQGLAQKLGLNVASIQYLRSGSAELQKQLKIEQELSLFDKDKAAQKVAAFNDSITTLKSRLMEVLQVGFVKLAEALGDTVNKINNWIVVNRIAIKDALTPFMNTLATIGNVLEIVGGFIGNNIKFFATFTGVVLTGVTALKGITLAMKLFTIAMSANPIGLILTGIAVTISLVIANFDKLKAAAIAIADNISIRWQILKIKLAKTFSPLIDFFKTLAHNLAVLFHPLIKVVLLVKDKLITLAEPLKSFVTSVKDTLTSVKDYFSGFFDWLGLLSSKIGNLLLDGIKLYFNSFIKMINSIIRLAQHIPGMGDLKEFDTFKLSSDQKPIKTAQNPQITQLSSQQVQTISNTKQTTNNANITINTTVNGTSNPDTTATAIVNNVKSTLTNNRDLTMISGDY